MCASSQTFSTKIDHYGTFFALCSPIQKLYSVSSNYTLLLTALFLFASTNTFLIVSSLVQKPTNGRGAKWNQEYTNYYVSMHILSLI